MQIGAINSINFKARGKYADCDCPECRPDLYYKDQQNDYDLDPQTLRDQYVKERDDVSPLTGIFMVGAGVAALKAGNKGVAYARRGLAYIGEIITKAGAKGLAKVKKNLNYDECVDKIQKFFARIKDDRRVNDERLEARFTDAVNAILSPKDKNGDYVVNKGKNIVETLNKFGIYLRGTSLFDHAVAIGLALPTWAEAGKRMESDMDKRQFHEGTLKENNIYEKVAVQVLKEALSEGI